MCVCVCVCECVRFLDGSSRDIDIPLPTSLEYIYIYIYIYIYPRALRATPPPCLTKTKNQTKTQTQRKRTRKRKAKEKWERQRRRERESSRERKIEREAEREGGRGTGREREGERERGKDRRDSFCMPPYPPKYTFDTSRAPFWEPWGSFWWPGSPQGRQRSPKAPQRKKQRPRDASFGELVRSLGDRFGTRSVTFASCCRAKVEGSSPGVFSARFPSTKRPKHSDCLCQKHNKYTGVWRFSLFPRTSILWPSRVTSASIFGALWDPWAFFSQLFGVTGCCQNSDEKGKPKRSQKTKKVVRETRGQECVRPKRRASSH